MLDRFSGSLIYGLHLLIGLSCVEVDTAGGCPPVCSARALVVVEGHRAPDADPSLRPGFQIVRVDAFVLQGPQQALDDDAIEAAPLSIQRDLGADPLPPVHPGEGRELRSLTIVHDLGRAELVDCIVPRLDAEVSLQGVRYPQGQHLPGGPVHDGDQVEEAAAHRDVGDVGIPDLIGPLHAQPTQ
jgi:hypothetical protein